MNYYIGLTIIGILSGIFAGIVGGGAEILIVPLLTLFGLLGTLKDRIGTSLFMLLPPIGIFASIKYYKKGHVDIFAALYMGIVFTLFASFSSMFALKVNQQIIKKIFGLFTIFSGLYIFLDK